MEFKETSGGHSWRLVQPQSINLYIKNRILILYINKIFTKVLHIFQINYLLEWDEGQLALPLAGRELSWRLLSGVVLIFLKPRSSLERALPVPKHYQLPQGLESPFVPLRRTDQVTVAALSRWSSSLAAWSSSSSMLYSTHGLTVAPLSPCSGSKTIAATIPRFHK